MSAPWSPFSWKDKPIAQVMALVFVLGGVVLMDYRTWNTLTKDTFQSQPSPSSYKCSSSDIRQRTRGTASPCYAFRGELVREVHGSPLNLHNPSLQIERLRHQLGLVQRNEAFLLHAGDCAESFEACTGVSSTDVFLSLPHFRPFARRLTLIAGKHLLENRTHPFLLSRPYLGRPCARCTHRANRGPVRQAEEQLVRKARGWSASFEFQVRFSP